MTQINQVWFVPKIQQNLDDKMQGEVAKHNALTTKVANLVNTSQRITLDLMQDESATSLDMIGEAYQNLLRNAKQFLPSSMEDVEPIAYKQENPREANQKLQHQMEHVQYLCNAEQTKATNLLDLSLKNYFAISNTLSEISKTLFGFIKHVLGNSTGR